MKANDFSLIQRTLEGDQSAFTELVNKYQKWVHTLVWRKIGDFHIAEELTQDVFLKVYKKLSTLKPTDHFPGWLYVIASRHCIAWYRKKQLPTTSLDTMPTSELEELYYLQHASSHSEQISLERQREVVKHLLRKLPESERTVVTLHYLAEMSCEEISEFLGVSPNTVKSRLHRARKRLANQEHLLHDASGIFQVSPTLTENIAREIARIKPASPSVSKPWIPWGISFAATLLVILLMAPGTLMLSRFQQPYSFEATSEMTVELIDVSVVRESKRKPDPQTRFGRAGTPSENNGSGFQTESPIIAAAQADRQDTLEAKPQWIQTGGPGGVSKPELFLTTDQTLYAIAKTGLYRLTEKADAWTLISASGPNREFDPVMAEQDDTLYLLTPDELLVSIDGGKTLNAIGTRPNGSVVALLITDGSQERDPRGNEMTMYLVLKTAVFRSNDAGKVWEPIGKVLQSDNALDVGSSGFRIWDALAFDNTLFVGTSRGLFRFIGTWEKLSLPTFQGINSLAVDGNRLYASTITRPKDTSDRNRTTAIFYSTNSGNSWTNITPNVHKFPTKLMMPIQIVSVEETLMVIGPGGMLLSSDGGETWTNPGKDPRAFGVSPVVALDEDNFYKSDALGVVRSTDGGLTWHAFMTGLVNSHILNLVTMERILYALTPAEILKSVDSGESWESVGVNTNGSASLEGAKTRLATADGVLYASISEFNKITLFRLSDTGDVCLPAVGVPDFKKVPLHTEGLKKHKDAWASSSNLVITQHHWKVDEHPIAEEWNTNRTFTLTENTIFMEYRHKLFRWRRGETAWHDTGLEDSDRFSHPDNAPKELTLAVSGNTIYVGKRDVKLSRSHDNGDTWIDITANLAFSFGHFKQILFAGSTLYVSTDKGVMHSRDDETWHVLTDVDGNRRIMDRIAVDGITVYGVCDGGVYQVDNQTNILEQITPELPHTATAFAVDSDIFYIGTKQNGVLRFQRDDP